jgi:hypothetical protein
MLIAKFKFGAWFVRNGAKRRKKRKRESRCVHRIPHEDDTEDYEEDDCNDIFDELVLLKENNQFSSYETKLLSLLSTCPSTYQRDCALYELALLYCQLGYPDERIDAFLSRLGYRYKLGRGVWNYDPSLSSSLKKTKGIAYCFDNVLPSEPNGLLTSLKNIFHTDSLFWSSHHYPTPAFFSYNVPLQKLDGDHHNSKKKTKTKRSEDNANIIQQLAQYLLPLVSKSFPELELEKNVSSVEWWAHNRPNGSATGHRVSCVRCCCLSCSSS